jgi:hypothetical protein
MWTLLIDIVFNLLAKGKRTPGIYVIALTLIVIAVAIVTFLNNAVVIK